MEKVDDLNKQTYDNQVQFSEPADLRLEVNVANYSNCKPALILFCKQIVTKTDDSEPLKIVCQQYLQLLEQIKKLQSILYQQKQDNSKLQKQVKSNSKHFEQLTQQILKIKKQLKAIQIQAENRKIFCQELVKRCTSQISIVDQIKQQIGNLSNAKAQNIKSIKEIYLQNYTRNLQKNKEILRSLEKWRINYDKYIELRQYVKDLQIKVQKIQNQNHLAELTFNREYEKFKRTIQNEINCNNMMKRSYFPSNIIEQSRNQGKITEKVKFRMIQPDKREWIDKILYIWLTLLCIYVFLFDSSDSSKNNMGYQASYQ